MKSGQFWCLSESTKNWEGRLIKRKHLLKIQSDRVIWFFIEQRIIEVEQQGINHHKTNNFVNKI